MRLIKQLGVGHHPFSKKYEFKGYFNEPTPALIATDYKAPKTVLELWGDEDNEKESDNMTKSNERYNADEQADFIQTEEEEWAAEIALRIKEGNLDPIPSKEIIRTKQHEFTYVSLFSGIGGFEQALNKLGGTCVMASEIDKFAEQAYQALYGHATVGDITKVKAEDVPDHDLLVGGFPCQSFSVAGKREGFEDTRGTMFFEIARIVSVKKPKILLLENVKGLVNHDKGRTLDTMFETLNEIGYIVDFNVLNSKFFGVPQNRERIFIVAIRKDLIESEPFSEESTVGNTIVPKRKRQIGEWAETFNFDWPQNDEVTTRLRDILEQDVDEKYYLDEGKTAKLVAQLEDIERVTDEINQVDNIDQYKRKRNNPQTGRIYGYGGVSPALSTMQGGGLEPKIATLGNVSNTGHRSENIHDVDGLSPTITSRDYKGAKLVMSEVRPVLTSDRINKSQNGRRFKEDGEESFTLTAQDQHGVAIRKTVIDDTQGFDGVRAYDDETPSLRSSRSGLKVAEEVTPKYRIRKLTPLECFRLQGFSDEVHQTLVDDGISDSQRYKMAGNAVTVNVIDALGEKLIAYL